MTLGSETEALIRAVIEPDAPASRWQPPHEFDGMRIVRSLGRGGMGHVFLAEEVALGRQVAIKFLTSRTTLSDIRNAKLLSEARVLAGLRHPGIVMLYRVGSAGGHAYLAHEFVDGPSLARATKPMPARRVLRIARDIAGALTAVHAAGLVHGDVKPSNVMLASDESARLIDFGLAHLESRPPRLHGGTPGYIAPEALRTGRSTSRSDAYAFALVLVEMLTGTTDPAALRAIPTARPRSAWAPPPELVAAVERALAPDEHQRPSLAALHELFAKLLSASDLVPSILPAAASASPSTAPAGRSEAESAPFDVVDAGASRQTIWMPRPWVIVAKQSGTLGVETASAMRRAGELTIAAGYRPSAFVDAVDVKGYTPEHRAVSSRWIGRALPDLEGMHVLTRSPMVQMGIAVANLMFGGAIKTYADREPFDRALEKALAHPSRR
jgi:serine/threonine protein kinase